MYLLYCFDTCAPFECNSVEFFQGRGFNTGVILMNLRVLREMNWMEMWKKIAVKELETMQYTQLADQVRQTCTKIAYGYYNAILMLFM